MFAILDKGLQRLHVNLHEFLIVVILQSLVIKASYNSILIIISCLIIFYDLFKQGSKTIKFDYRTILVLSSPFIWTLLSSLYHGLETEGDFVLRNLPFLVLPVLIMASTRLKSSSVHPILGLFTKSMLVYNMAILLTAVVRQIWRHPDFSEINWYLFSYRGLLKYFDIHATYLGLLNNLVVLYLLWQIGNDKSENKRFIYFSLIISVLITLLSGSRIQVLILVMIFLQFLFRNFNWKKLLIFSGGLIFAAVIFYNIPIVKERVLDTVFNPDKEFEYAKYGENPGQSASLGRRIDLSLCSLESIAKKPILGYGSDYINTSGLKECYKEKGLKNAYSEDYNTHNQYLGWLVRGGIILLSVFIVLFGLSLKKSWINKDSLHVGVLLIIMICCLTENVLERHFGIVYFALLNSLFIIIHQPKEIVNQNNN